MLSTRPNEIGRRLTDAKCTVILLAQPAKVVRGDRVMFIPVYSLIALCDRSRFMIIAHEISHMDVHPTVVSAEN
jgi:hypothetical protein